MTHRERIETAWAFREPDRVPIEMRIGEQARKHPRAQRLVRLVEEHADNFFGAPAYDWGFFGHPARRSERLLEDTGEAERIEWTMHTPAGDFTAVIRRPRFTTGIEDYHWERRYIAQPGDLERLLSVPLELRAPDVEGFRRTLERVGEDGVVYCALLHPLGVLVRHAEMEEMYAWLRTEAELVHRFLEVTNSYVVEAVELMAAAGIRTTFMSWAHEMLIDPWLGREHFEEFVFPYDRRVYAAVHAGGSRFRAHCHGNCMHYLERFHEMGIDSIEPLEPPPYGDVDLAEAKRLVGDHMLLSGNIASQAFVFREPEQVEQEVREAIEAAAAGGGFTLRTTGGTGGTGAVRNEEQLDRSVINLEAYMHAALKYGKY
ncbi:MAG: uroporphyrinogen decarboxylase family protein [Armatimonadota bacterium]|nr:uroporphyrinogen decarboxylase family protein [Armatimonadota bacterium]